MVNRNRKKSFRNYLPKEHFACVYALLYLVNGPCTFSTQPIYFSQMTCFYCHLLLLFVLTFSLLVAKVIEQSANDTQHKEARELTTNCISRGTTTCSHDSNQQIQHCENQQNNSKYFHRFYYKGFVMFVIYPLCGKTRKG